ncbi:MAG: T9SS type A sorting domain-containing protein, partial [Flavobacterium sp.]
AEKAANIITKKPLLTSIIEENTLNTGQTFSKTIFSAGLEPIVVSISWTDVAGTANSGTTDPTTLNLVNDLDVRVVRNSTTFFPWTLDPANPTNQAVRTMDNNRDNFEKIEIDTPLAGAYTIQITHKKTNLVNNSQNYTLIVSGVNQNLSLQNIITNDLPVLLYPNPVKENLQFSFFDQVMIDLVTILDATGKEVFKTNEIYNNSINVSNLQSGIYFIKLSSKEKNTVKKFIKE